MSRIGPAADRPIPTDEKTSATQETSTTESTQKTGIAGEALPKTELITKEPAPAGDAKGQQFESHLSGLARQTELQSQVPTPDAPVLNDRPDANPNLNPNIHLDEKIDVAKNLPDGQTINTGLGTDWGLGKGKSGPDHMGVDVTTGGMRAPADVIADVLKPTNTNQPNTDAYKPDGTVGKSVDGGGVKANNFAEGHGGTPPPGAELNFRAPNTNLVGQATAAEYQTIIGYNNNVPAAAPAAETKGATKAETELKSKELSEKTKKEKEAWDKKTAGKMTDPDAGGGVVVGGGSPEEIERAVKAHFGQVEHSINPDLDATGGPGGTAPEKIKKPIDLVKDPIEQKINIAVTESTTRKATLASDIHGPRTVNPDAGFEPPIAGGDTEGPHGPDPNTGNQG